MKTSDNEIDWFVEVVHGCFDDIGDATMRTASDDADALGFFKNEEEFIFEGVLFSAVKAFFFEAINVGVIGVGNGYGWHKPDMGEDFCWCFCRVKDDFVGRRDVHSDEAAIASIFGLGRFGMHPESLWGCDARKGIKATSMVVVTMTENDRVDAFEGDTEVLGIGEEGCIWACVKEKPCVLSSNGKAKPVTACKSC